MKKKVGMSFNDLGPGWILPTSAETSPEGRFPFSKYPNMDDMVVEEEIWFPPQLLRSYLFRRR